MKNLKRILIATFCLIFTLTMTTSCERRKKYIYTTSDVTSTIYEDVSGETSGISKTDNISVLSENSAENNSQMSTQSAQSGNQSQNPANSVVPTIPPTTNDSFRKNAYFEEKVTNLNGVTIKIASPWNEWKITSGAPPKQVEAANALTAISKDYNCKIEVVNVNPSTFLQDIVTNFSAGKIYADIIQYQGSIMPLTDYVANVANVNSLNMSKNEWNKFIGSSTVHKGVQYGVGFMMTQNLAISQSVVFFNKSLAEQYKLGDLYSIAKSNQWTWAKFLDITNQVKTKSGGKTKGMVVQHVSLLERLLHTNNIKLVAKSNDGEYFFNFDNNNLISGMQFWADYVKNGNLVEIDGPEDYGAAESKEFMTRGAMFYIAEYLVASSQINPYMEDVYGILPLPKGPGSSNYVSVNTTKYFCLTKDNPNLEAAGKVLVAIAKRTSWDMKEWDEIQLDSALRDEASLDMMHRITDFVQIDHEAALRGTVNYKNAAMMAILTQEKTPINAMTEIKGGENNEINRLFN